LKRISSTRVLPMGTVLMLVISRYRPPYDRASAKCREHREKWPPENTLWHRFFTAFNQTPPIVGFASIGYKNSVRSIETSGEFVWNLVTRPLAEAMNQTCAAVAPEVSAFELADLTPLASTLVAPPRIAESPVSFEPKNGGWMYLPVP
jgi:hypothetical protein